MRLPSKSIERTLIGRGARLIAAVDEAGRGSWAGPVVAAVVLFESSFFVTSQRHLRFIRDSKLVNEAGREKYYKMLTECTRMQWEVGAVDAKTIDKINILEATLRAMTKAIRKLTRKPDIVLVDGIFSIPGVSYAQECFPHGDRRIFSIACASIIAKVTRDRLMTGFAKQYPEYGFEKHKGYGTKLHQIQLASVGPSPIHRKSYRPVAELA